MRRAILVITFFLVAAVAVSYASTGGQTAAGSRRQVTAAEQRDKAETKTKEAAKAVEGDAYAQKAEFVDKMKKELAEIGGQIDRLSGKAEKSNGLVKADAKDKVKESRKKWAEAKKLLDKVESATESTWEHHKGGFKKAHGELKDSVEKLGKWFDEKIKL